MPVLEKCIIVREQLENKSKELQHQAECALPGATECMERLQGVECLPVPLKMMTQVACRAIAKGFRGRSPEMSPEIRPPPPPYDCMSSEAQNNSSGFVSPNSRFPSQPQDGDRAAVALRAGQPLQCGIRTSLPSWEMPDSSSAGEL